VISRRSFAWSSLAFAIAPKSLTASSASRVSLTGSMEQGSLVIGKVDPGSDVKINGGTVLVSKDGTFAFGFEYDQKSPMALAIKFPDGTSETREVAAVARKYEVQSITGLPQHLVTPSPEEQARIAREHARVAEARKRDSNYDWFAEPLDWPASGIISGLFGSQRILNGIPSAPHFGVDIAAPEGAPIHAPAGAKVLIADAFLLEGNYTQLDHGHGVFTGYLHQSRQLVKEGDAVARGQQIGAVGKTGRATGPHLHWAMNWFQVRLDPSRSTRTPAPART
jgi:murein DD-endopeptidase MepM/ murein hydrolase activator NlpD